MKAIKLITMSKVNPQTVEVYAGVGVLLALLTTSKCADAWSLSLVHAIRYYVQMCTLTEDCC
jgi:hypothetical protein